MKAMTIPQPLVVLVNCEYIIYACSPKLLPLKAIGLLLANKLWLIYIKIRYDNTPVINSY